MQSACHGLGERCLILYEELAFPCLIGKQPVPLPRALP
jgi:hypothetical protein